MLLRKFNRSFSEKINVFLVNNVKNLVRVFAKDKVFLRKKVVNQWNNSLFNCNSIIYIDFKRFCENLIDHFFRKSMLF